MRASSVIEVLAQVQSNAPETMYRGQANADWKLLPSLARFSEYVLDGYNRIVDLEANLIDHFLQYAMLFQDLREMPLVELLVHCQHYGLPTRLLDWTTNPLTALYFAVADPLCDDLDGSVHVLRPAWWRQGTRHMEEVGSLKAFFPELLNERVAAQDGCFIAFPLPPTGMEVAELTQANYPKEVRSLSCITVAKEEKRSLRRQLAALGVTHRTIHPGLDGVAKWVRSKLSQFQV